MLVFDSKCLGCVYVQRESKSSDFKGVSGTVIVSVYTLHYCLMHGED
jgi:lysophosphatidylcholine acyltransferase/lyso-PAF acetyltransferase